MLLAKPNLANGKWQQTPNATKTARKLRYTAFCSLCHFVWKTIACHRIIYLGQLTIQCLLVFSSFFSFPGKLWMWPLCITNPVRYLFCKKESTLFAWIPCCGALSKRGSRSFTPFLFCCTDGKFLFNFFSQFTGSPPFSCFPALKSPFIYVTLLLSWYPFWNEYKLCFIRETWYFVSTSNSSYWWWRTLIYTLYCGIRNNSSIELVFLRYGWMERIGRMVRGRLAVW